MRRKTDDLTAGELRSKVEVQRPVYTPDGAGGQITRWEKVCDIWCFIQELSGRETYGDTSTGRVRSQEGWEFITWYRTDIDTQFRLSFRGEFFNIREVGNVLLRNKFTRLVGEKGVEQ